MIDSGDNSPIQYVLRGTQALPWSPDLPALCLLAQYQLRDSPKQSTGPNERRR